MGGLGCQAAHVVGGAVLAVRVALEPASCSACSSREGSCLCSGPGWKQGEAACMAVENWAACTVDGESRAGQMP